MPWDPRNRRDLPKGWPAIRQRVFKRDQRHCRLRYAGCIDYASEVDHIGDRNNHDLENLQAACLWCHARKSSRQGHQAQGFGELRRRPPEQHPGIIRPSD
jgi:5-methylcytosine-specific restriction endonuclease McrA